MARRLPMLLVAATLGVACGGAPKREPAAAQPPPADASASRPAAPSDDARPSPPEPVAERGAPDVVREIRTAVGDAARACRSADAAELAELHRCVCRRVAKRQFTVDGAATSLRWPLPTTPSGSTATEDGLELVPLGPVFEIALDASGAVTACGVTPPGRSGDQQGQP